MRALYVDLAALGDVHIADLGAQVTAVGKDLAGDGVPSVVLGQGVFYRLDQGGSARQVFPDDGLGHGRVTAIGTRSRRRLALLCRGPGWLAARTRKETE